MSEHHWLVGLAFLTLSGIGLYHVYRWIDPKQDKLTYESRSDKAVFETAHGKHEIRYLNRAVQATIEQTILEREAPGKPLGAYELYQLHKRLDANGDNVITPEETQHYRNNLSKE